MIMQDQCDVCAAIIRCDDDGPFLCVDHLDHEPAE